jgi:hypothetical protein
MGLHPNESRMELFFLQYCPMSLVEAVKMSTNHDGQENGEKLNAHL